MAKQKKEQKSVPKPPPYSVPWLNGNRLYLLIVFVFSCALYCNTLFNDYNLDDELVTQNQQVTSQGWNVLKLNFDAFNSAGLQDSSFTQKLKYFMPVVFRVPYYQDKSGYKYEYRPLVIASFALEHALFAKKEIVNGAETETDSPFVSHLINVLLYAVLCSLLFLTLCRLFKSYNAVFPLIICLLFAAYPMHTEVVASIKNRDEILALIFGLLSLGFSFRYIEKRRAAVLILVSLFFVLGILSKPTAIVFAMLIPLCIVMFTNAGYLRVMLLATAVIIPAVVFSRLYSSVQQIILALVLYLGVTGLYILKDPALVWNKIINSIKSSYSYFTSNPVRNINSQATGFGFLKNPVTALALLFFFSSFMAISIFGICIYNSWLVCIPLLLAGVLYAVVRNDIRVLLTTPIVLVALFALVKLSPQSGFIETGLIAFLGSQIFSGQKSFRLIGLVNCFIYIMVSVLYMHTFHFLLLALFIGLANPKYFVASVVIIALSSLLFFKRVWGLAHGHGSIFHVFVLMPLIYPFVFMLRKNRGGLAISSAAIMLPLLFVVYFTMVRPAGNNNMQSTVERTYYTVNSIKAIDPTPLQSIRPLRYPEYPLSYADPFALKFGTAMEVLGKYLRMTLVPYPMSYYYGYSCITPQNITEIIPIISLLIYLAILASALYFFTKIPVLSFSILFYFISIAVFSGLISPVPGMVGDRFLLIPSIGYCVLIASVMSLVFKQGFDDPKPTPASLKGPFQIGLGIILVLYSGLTIARNTDWKDRLTLFRHDIKVVDNSAQAHNLLAVQLFIMANKEKDPEIQKRLLEEAIPHFKRAIEIYPGFMNASYDLGRTYESLERNALASGLKSEARERADEALAQYQYTVKLDTTFVAPCFSIGTMMQNKGQYTEAIAMYQKFLTQYPRQLEAYTNLSFAYFQIHDFEKSIATNRIAIKETGEPLFPTINIAKTYMVMNKPDSALLYWERARAMKPDDPVINATIEKLRSPKAKQ